MFVAWTPHVDPAKTVCPPKTTSKRLNQVNVCQHAGVADGTFQAATTAATAAAAVADPADPADQNINTFFRAEDSITSTDAFTEENIPGLAKTDHIKEWRAIPNLEHFSPFITSVVPFLPNMKVMALAMRWHFPMAWPLAGAAGEHKDWINTAFSVYGRAFMGMGPRPLVYPTILIPTPAVGVLGGVNDRRSVVQGPAWMRGCQAGRGFVPSDVSVLYGSNL